ncbi:ATP-binding protein [Streptomyces flavofungini]|uniref:Tetratricopeptide repeat protein n=1 Tax=Streptomyces flavofungini TaxID=68200 RepID=A0ABS0WZS5_9ACTN|nr:BTAD domain-containing putative transcriptional regulator [Streptomyces flavofungini]MBJ3806441.1 tetratricopeptide repeat protein [Streptomyces flavofungini]GHC84950.1 SARP family transcriptional regulator [Streptomyces flavofungini]
MRFGILGPLDVRTPDGTPLDPGGPRPRALLTLLLLDAGRTVPVARLTDGLYGDEPPAGAANALQSQVSRLRKRLGLDIGAVPTGYCLTVSPEDVDLHRFERLAREGRRLLGSGDHARAAALLREALGLWRGPALAELPDAAPLVARLEELRLAAVQDRVDADLAMGGGPDLVPELRELISGQPLSERLYGQLMRALHAGGRPAEALTVYEEARRALSDALGADPSAELSALHLELLRGQEPARQRGVPAQVTRFIGRADELARIGALLADARLVTLTGPGGAGKTRLAVEAARGLPDVCFVELAPLADGAQVPYAILTALGVRDGLHAPGGDATERLLSALHGRELLLVLDNCEHLVDAAAAVTGLLLGDCPGVRVLATSREGLGITGEALWPVPPLAAEPAARLFADRAAAVRPDAAGLRAARARRLTDEICAALDGLPLAIELAAARLRTLTLDELAARLGDRFRLLSRGDRTKAPRHRTLHAVVEWSWELLDDEERDLARRLTVFPSGATLDAVEAVCGIPYPEDLLASLVEKSFLDVTDGRYGMLRTIHAFCARQLAAAGEEERLRDAHAAYFLRLAEHAEPMLRGGDQLPWLAGLAAESGNLDGALRHLTRTDPHGGLRLLAALSWFWRLRGLYGERRARALELLDAVGAEPPEGLFEEYVLCVINTIAGDGDDPAEPERLARADRLVAALKGPLRLPHLVVQWSVAGGPDHSMTELVRAQVGAHPWGVALLDLGLGFQEQFAGRPDAAEAAFAGALAGFRETGDRWGMANCLDPLGMFADWRGERDRALALLDEGLVHVRDLAAPEETADLLHQRATVLLHRGDFEEAAAHYTRATDLARTAGVPDKVATARRGLGDAARLSGDTARARAHYEAALETYAANWFSLGQSVRTLVGLGRTALAESRPEEAADWVEQARVLASDTGELAEVAEALAAVATDPEEAARLLGAAHGLRGTLIAGDPDVVRVEAATRARLSPEAYEKAFEQGRSLRSAAVRER